MVDQLKVLRSKDLIYRVFPLVVTTLLFLMIAPIQQLQFIRNVDPVLLVVGAVLLLDAFILLIEFFRNLPDAGNHLGARTGSYLFLIMAIIVGVFSVALLSDQYNPFENVGENTIILTLSAILGITAITQYASVHPMLFHGKRNLAHAIRTG